MKRILLLAAVAAFIVGCSDNKKSPVVDNASSSEAVVDTVYNASLADSLIKTDKPSQAEYAAMIEQCRAINRKLTDKLAAIDFRPDMTDAQIEAAMAKLEDDKEIPTLEAQSRALLCTLQNADLDQANRDRYDRMVADAAAALSKLQ